MQLISSAGTETVARLLGLGGGDAGPATPTSASCSSTTRASSRTRSRSCCATRRRHRCSRGGSPATSSSTEPSSSAARSSRCSTAAATATSATSRTPTSSTSAATSTATSRSATAPTSASVPRSPASKPRSRCDETLRALPDVGGRREPARAGAHQHRARLRLGAHAGPLTWVHSHTSASATSPGSSPGAGATRFLAAFGAQVIRVEDPGAPGHVGHPARRRRPTSTSGAASTSAARSTTTTSRSSASPSTCARNAGKELLRELVAVSDVVTENFAAGVLARMGFSYDELRAIKPDIVYVSNSGFGARGPYSPYKTWGPIVQAVAGSPSAAASPTSRPRAGASPTWTTWAPTCMAVAILAGLVHRNRTGEGQWIDMACTEAGTTLVGPDLLDYTVNGRPLRRPGQPNSNRSHAPAMAPHGIYPARGDDDWVAIACRDDDDWARPRGGDRRAVGDRRPQYDTLAGRLGGRGRARRSASAAWTATRDRFTHRGGAPRRGRAGVGGRVARGPHRPRSRARASGACGRPRTTARWATSASTASRCTCPRPTGRSSAARRASASTPTTCCRDVLGLDDDEIDAAARRTAYERERDRTRARSTASASSSSPASTPRSAGKLLARPRRRRDRGRAAGRSPEPRVRTVRRRRSEDPERSLCWWNYNTSKRGVVLDLDTRRRRPTVPPSSPPSADIVLEGEPPGSAGRPRARPRRRCAPTTRS